VPGMMDLVEDDQRAPGLGALPVQGRMSGNLRVRDRDPMEIRADRTLRVAVGRVDRDAKTGRRSRPLVLQVLRRGDDRDRDDLAPVQQLPRDGQRIRCLPSARRGNEQEVTTCCFPEVLPIRVLLPAAETLYKGTHSSPSPPGSDS